MENIKLLKLSVDKMGDLYEQVGSSSHHAVLLASTWFGCQFSS